MTAPGTPQSPASAEDDLHAGVPPSEDWHARTVHEAEALLETDQRHGLTEETAAARLAKYGRNELVGAPPVRWFTVFGRQFVDVLILILVIAAAVSLVVGEVVDAAAILVIVILNGILGFIQEWRAEQAIEALQQMLSPHTEVLREGEQRSVEAAALVPGDVVILDVGDRVPADLRLAAAVNLAADESALTGESASVGKATTPVDQDSEIAERHSMCWMGTTVTAGRGTGIVVGTGMQTQFGRIAELTESVGREPTPLQQKLDSLGRRLGVFGLGVSVIVAVAGILRGNDAFEMFLTGVSLAVAVVPEGLPAVVTITLALGIRSMAQRKALLRRLQAAETLGAASVICTDKTGTLTQNEMTVRHIVLPAGSIEVGGTGYAPEGEFTIEGERADPGARSDLMAMLDTGLRCNRARIRATAEGWRQIGEPTEAALVTAAMKAGLSQDPDVDVVEEFSFSSERKRMTVVERTEEGFVAHLKGAPEIVLERCDSVRVGTEVRPLDEELRAELADAYVTLASEGLRTLAVARRDMPGDSPLDVDDVESNLTYLGTFGILDPPRPEVPGAVAVARRAGIDVVMITGDAPATALAIAGRIGLRSTRAVTGRELAQMDDARVLEALDDEAVFCRTAPEDKMRIVSLLQEQGNVAAMTGDGVNDAPALKKADIGVAMGIRGTDVARSASDMVLTDDNFASIVGAVEEGRRQFDNIKKFVRYLLSSNVGEIVAIFGNILLGGPLILLPVQILWMNLITDGVTAVALGVEPGEHGLMDRPPRKPTEGIIGRSGVVMIALLGAFIGLATLAVFQTRLDGTDQGAAVAQTMAFTSIVLLEKMNVFNFRALKAPIRRIGFFSNPWLLVAWTSMVGLQVAAVYTPFLQRVLNTVPLEAADWLLIAGVAIPIFVIAETIKVIMWRLRTDGSAAEDTPVT